MKTRQNKFARCRGVSLIECLIYIMMLSSVSILAGRALFGSWENTNQLRRNADDIARVLDAGERWRQDVRTASGPLQTKENQMVIPQAKGKVSYRFSEGKIIREAGPVSVVLLSEVKNSQMSSETPQACRWELELKTRKKNVQLRPLFSFAASRTVTP